MPDSSAEADAVEVEGARVTLVGVSVGAVDVDARDALGGEFVRVEPCLDECCLDEQSGAESEASSCAGVRGEYLAPQEVIPCLPDHVNVLILVAALVGVVVDVAPRGAVQGEVVSKEWLLAELPEDRQGDLLAGDGEGLHFHRGGGDLGVLRR